MAQTFDNGENKGSIRTKLNDLIGEHNDHLEDEDNPHNVTKSQVGLGNVDNTSDEDKPVSTAQQAALDDKAGAVATQAALDKKVGFSGVAKVGTALQFNENAVYGTFGSPVSGNVNLNAADIKLGTKVLMIHTGGSEPSYGSEFIKMASSKTYNTSNKNYYEFTCVTVAEGANKIIFRIDN